MGRVQFWMATSLGSLAVAVLIANVVLVVMNRGLQGEVAARQQFVQQSGQLEGLYKEIVRALAELGSRSNDEAVRALLMRQGITYTVNAAPAPPATAASAKPRK